MNHQGMLLTYPVDISRGKLEGFCIKVYLLIVLVFSGKFFSYDRFSFNQLEESLYCSIQIWNYGRG